MGLRRFIDSALHRGDRDQFFRQRTGLSPIPRRELVGLTREQRAQIDIVTTAEWRRSRRHLSVEEALAHDERRTPRPDRTERIR